MKFYTYVSQIGNRLYIREIDNKGVEYSDYEHFNPTVYVPCNQSQADFRTLDYKPLGSFSLGSIEEAKSWIEQNSGVSNFQFVQLNPVRTCLYDVWRVPTTLVEVLSENIIFIFNPALMKNWQRHLCGELSNLI